MRLLTIVLAAVAIVTSAAGTCFAASGSPFDVDPRQPN